MFYELGNPLFVHFPFALLRDLILPSFLQLSFSPSTPMNSHVRVICLLVSLLLDCCGLAVVCGLLGASYGMHTLSFMAAEVGAQTVVALHPIATCFTLLDMERLTRGHFLLFSRL